MKVSIAGLEKHVVLASLWNAARRWSFLDVRPAMSESRARNLTSLPDLYFDWVDSRCLKVDLAGVEFDPYLYDRDNGGEGAARRVIELLRQFKNEVPEHGKQQKVSEVVAAAPQEVHGDGAGQAVPPQALLQEECGTDDSAAQPAEAPVA